MKTIEQPWLRRRFKHGAKIVNYLLDKNFEMAARANSRATLWATHRSVLAHEPLGFMRHHISREQIVVGDKTGVN